MVDDFKEVEVVLLDGRRFVGEVVEAHMPWDLALVQVVVEDSRPLQLALMDDVEIGDWVASVGHGEGATPR